MTLHFHQHPDGVLQVRQHSEEGRVDLILGVEEQEILINNLLAARGRIAVEDEVFVRLTRPSAKAKAAAARVARYLKGRRSMVNLDQEELQSVFVNREDEPRRLLASDLQALIDHLKKEENQ